jgi:hypothetical protein
LIVFLFFGYATLFLIITGFLFDMNSNNETSKLGVVVNKLLLFDWNPLVSSRNTILFIVNMLWLIMLQQRFQNLPGNKLHNGW